MADAVATFSESTSARIGIRTRPSETRTQRRYMGRRSGGRGARVDTERSRVPEDGTEVLVIVDTLEDGHGATGEQLRRRPHRRGDDPAMEVELRYLVQQRLVDDVGRDIDIASS